MMSPDEVRSNQDEYSTPQVPIIFHNDLTFVTHLTFVTLDPDNIG
jgi:hypothetical protein